MKAGKKVKIFLIYLLSVCNYKLNFLGMQIFFTG